MQLVSLRDPFNRRDLLRAHDANLRHARPLRPAVNQHGAGTALPFAAPILCARQIEMLPQHRQQAGLRVRVNSITASINNEMYRRHNEAPEVDFVRRSLADVSSKIINPHTAFRTSVPGFS
jgi:hypothetical protein